MFYAAYAEHELVIEIKAVEHAVVEVAVLAFIVQDVRVVFSRRYSPAHTRKPAVPACGIAYDIVLVAGPVILPTSGG